MRGSYSGLRATFQGKPTVGGDDVGSAGKPINKPARNQVSERVAWHPVYTHPGKNILPRHRPTVGKGFQYAPSCFRHVHRFFSSGRALGVVSSLVLTCRCPSSICAI